MLLYEPFCGDQPNIQTAVNVLKLLMGIYIILTSPCNEHPRKPRFKQRKMGLAGVYIISLILVQNIDCGYTVLTSTTIYVLSKDNEISLFFLTEISFPRAIKLALGM